MSNVTMLVEKDKESGWLVGKIVEKTIKATLPVPYDGYFADDSALTNVGLELDKAQIEFR